MTNKCKGLNLTKWWEKNKNNSARGKERDEMENPDNQNLNDFVDIEAGRGNFGTGQIRPDPARSDQVRLIKILSKM